MWYTEKESQQLLIKYKLLTHENEDILINRQKGKKKSKIIVDPKH